MNLPGARALSLRGPHKRKRSTQDNTTPTFPMKEASDSFYVEPRRCDTSKGLLLFICFISAEPYYPMILIYNFWHPSPNPNDAYDDSQLSMPIMADLIRLRPLTLHYAYFVLTPTICSIIFYTAPTQIHSLHYVDALFMCFSAMTGTGLNVVRLHN